MKELSPKAQIKLTAWPLLIGTLFAHFWIAQRLELKWFMETQMYDFELSLALIVLIIIAADRFIPLSFAAYFRGMKALAVGFFIAGLAALYTSGAIMFDISTGQRAKKVEAIAEADSVYSPVVVQARDALVYYSALEKERGTSYRSSKGEAAATLAFADSARFAKAEKVVQVSASSKLLFFVLQFGFLLIGLYCTYLFKISGSYEVKDSKSQKAQPIQNFEPSAQIGGHSAKKKSRRRRNTQAIAATNQYNDGGAKVQRTEDFYNAIQYIIDKKRSGEYDDGDGRPGTSNVSTATEAMNINGINEPKERTAIYRAAAKSADELEAQLKLVRIDKNGSKNGSVQKSAENGAASSTLAE